MIKPFYKIWFQQHVFKTGACCIWFDTTRRLIQPGANFTKHDMIHRNIRSRINGPVFIKRSSAIGNPPSPGGVAFPRCKLVSQVGVPVLSQRIQDGLCTQQAHIQTNTVRLHSFGKVGCYAGFQCIRHKAPVQRNT